MRPINPALEDDHHAEVSALIETLHVTGRRLALVSTIINLAHALKRKVVAEEIFKGKFLNERVLA